VESGDGLCERPHGIQRKPALLSHTVIKLVLLEAAHEQHPFNRLSSATNLERAVFSGSYRQNFKVELTSGARVDTELVEAS
jgi:hypothetical protein